MATVQTIEETDKELTKQLSLLKQRNKNLANIVDVEKDIVIKSKEIQTAAGAVKNQYESVKESVFSGIESFTTGLFGGPIGGLINTLTIGTLKRRKENAKAEADKQKEKDKKTATEELLHEEGLKATAEILKGTEKYKRMSVERITDILRRREVEAETLEAEEQIKEQQVKALELIKRKNQRSAEANGGTSDNGDGDNGAQTNGGTADGNDGIITAIGEQDQLLIAGFGLASPPFLETLTESIKGQADTAKDTEEHLQYMADNTEDAETRRERLRSEKGAKKAGGILSKVKKKKDGGIDWVGTIATMAKFLLPAGALAGATAMLGTGLAALGAVALPLVVVGAAMKAIYDGFMGWMNAEDWGVSKVSGALGGFFGGDAEGGIANMFINAGKWAAIGAGIGSVVPVVGTIAGGLIGAAFGAIMGLIGGKKLAEGFDAIGKWFKDSFLAIWDVIMPDWVKQINFEWTDIFPTGLVKLFSGEYFTVDVPSFSWYSLFPNFLVEWFKGTAEKISDKPWSWTDIFPKFVVDFFTGAVAKEDYKFSWTDLFPTWLVNIFSSAGEAFTETPFHWYSLFPDWLVNIIKGVKITGGTDAWEWTDLFPGWLTKVFKAGKEKGTTETGFDWTLLLPDWMAAAWDSSKALAGRAKGGIESLWEMVKQIFIDLKDKIIGLIPESLLKIADDPAGFVTDLASDAASSAVEGVSNFASSAVEGASNLLSSLNPFGGDARGAVIVNKPSWLPSSGRIVGEHASWSGRGAYTGGIPDGGPEAIIPLGADRAGVFIDPMARSIAGAVMNELMMERIGGAGAAAAQPPAIIDSSTVNNVTNNTLVRSPSPSGPGLHFEGRDFVSKIA